MNPIKLFNTVVRMLNEHHDSDWQRQLAGRYAFGTAIVMPVVTLVLAVAFFVSGSPYAVRMLPYFVTGTLVSLVIYTAYKRGFIRFVGLYIIFLYLLLGFGLVWSVGIGVSAMVLCSASVIFAGTLCGYWCAFGLATTGVGFLFGFRAAELHGLVHPLYVLSQKPTGYSALVLLALLFHLLTAVSGSLFRLERTRQRIREIEQGFAQQKSQLTHKLKKQRQKLQSAELEKMQQVYRLAEVGEVSTALMHDLANNLTSLTLEIEGIETQKSTTAVRRAKSQIKQINSMLNRTRQQLKGEYHPKVFDLVNEVGRTVKLLEAPARQAGVTLEWVKPPQGKQFECLGENVLFGQLVTNIIYNAIESYGQALAPHNSARKVRIALKGTRSSMELTVTDWGQGIEPEAASQIFEPFYTTKQHGLGMGLYLTRRFIENNFGGSLELHNAKQYTTFCITLPKSTPSSLKIE